jgi:hypothetical protein
VVSRIYLEPWQRAPHQGPPKLSINDHNELLGQQGLYTERAMYCQQQQQLHFKEALTKAIEDELGEVMEENLRASCLYRLLAGVIAFIAVLKQSWAMCIAIHEMLLAA